MIAIFVFRNSDSIRIFEKKYQNDKRTKRCLHRNYRKRQGR